MQSKKIDSLTGLRFIAALMVLAAHAYPLSGKWTIYPFGQAGVALFFTLSGFVICLSYFDRFQNSYLGNLKPFFVSRLARIYPLYLLVFLAGFLLNHHPAPASLPFGLTLTQSWLGSDDWSRAYNPVSWSLSVEFFFYLSFPFLVFPLLKLARSTPALILTGAVVYLSTMLYLLAAQLSDYGSLFAPMDFSGPVYYMVYTNPLTRWSDFLLGCIAARIFMLRLRKPLKLEPARFGVTPAATATVSLIMLVILAAYGMGLSGIPVLTYGNFITPLLALIVFNLASYPALPATILSSKLFVLLGNASFAFYMTHYLIIYYLRPLLLPDYNSPLSSLNLAVIVTAIIALSILLYRLVETPARKFIISRFIA